MKRLSQLDTSNQNRSEIKSGIDKISSSQDVLMTFMETFSTHRRDLNNLKEAKSNKKLKHTRNPGFWKSEQKASESNQGSVLELET